MRKGYLIPATLAAVVIFCFSAQWESPAIKEPAPAPPLSPPIEEPVPAPTVPVPSSADPQEKESPPPEPFDVLCADGQTATICKDIRIDLDEFVYSIHHSKDDSSYTIMLTYPDEICTVSILDVENALIQSFTVDTHTRGDDITFIDANLDGYADMRIYLGGAMNEEQALYLWDPNLTEYCEVSSDKPLFYFEAYEGHIKNWVRESMVYTVVQDLIWEGENKLVLRSEDRVYLG